LTAELLKERLEKETLSDSTKANEFLESIVSKVEESGEVFRQIRRTLREDLIQALEKKTMENLGV
jgi:hypothetical protein